MIFSKSRSGRMKRTDLGVDDIKEGQVISFYRVTKSKEQFTFGTVTRVTANTVYCSKGNSSFIVRKKNMKNCKVCEK